MPDGDILASDKEKPPSGGGAYTEYVRIHDGGFDAVSRKIAPSVFVERIAIPLILPLYLLRSHLGGVLVAENFAHHATESAVDIVHQKVDEKEGDGAEDGDRPIVKHGDKVGREDRSGARISSPCKP